MQRRAASPITATIKPPQAAINTISNEDSLFVSMPLESWRLLPGIEPLCVLVTDTVVVASVGLIIIVVDTIELAKYSTLGEDSRFIEPVGTEEYTID